MLGILPGVNLDGEVDVMLDEICEISRCVLRRVHIVMIFMLYNLVMLNVQSVNKLNEHVNVIEHNVHNEANDASSDDRYVVGITTHV